MEWQSKPAYFLVAWSRTRGDGREEWVRDGVSNTPPWTPSPPQTQPGACFSNWPGISYSNEVHISGLMAMDITLLLWYIGRSTRAGQRPTADIPEDSWIVPQHNWTSVPSSVKKRCKCLFRALLKRLGITCIKPWHTLDTPRMAAGDTVLLSCLCSEKKGKPFLLSSFQNCFENRWYNFCEVPFNHRLKDQSHCKQQSMDIHFYKYLQPEQIHDWT